MQKGYTYFLDKIEQVILFILAIMLMIMTASIFYQVILRYIFKMPNIWAEELTRFLFVWVTFLGSALCIRRNSHLRVEFFINLLKPTTRAFVQIIIYLLIMVFLFVLLKLGLVLVASTTVNKSAGMQIPMAVPYSAIVVGTLLMFLYSIELIFKQIYFLKSEKQIRCSSKNKQIGREGA